MKLGRSPSFSRGIELSSDPEIHMVNACCCCPQDGFPHCFAIKYFMSTSFLVPSRFCFVLDLCQRRFKVVAVEE